MDEASVPSDRQIEAPDDLCGRRPAVHHWTIVCPHFKQLAHWRCRSDCLRRV